MSTSINFHLFRGSFCSRPKHTGLLQLLCALETGLLLEEYQMDADIRSFDLFDVPLKRDPRQPNTLWVFEVPGEFLYSTLSVQEYVPCLFFCYLFQTRPEVP